MKLLIIRHGESQADILKVHEGRADFELTERGHRQAEAMSKYVRKNYQVKKFTTVPLKEQRKRPDIWLPNVMLLLFPTNV